MVPVQRLRLERSHCQLVASSVRDAMWIPETVLISSLARRRVAPDGQGDDDHWRLELLIVKSGQRR